MRAAQIGQFGGPDVLVVNEVDRPVPADGEVLVRVEASSVNGHDAMVRSGGLKVISGRKFPLGTGLDFAAAWLWVIARNQAALRLAVTGAPAPTSPTTYGRPGASQLSRPERAAYASGRMPSREF